MILGEVKARPKDIISFSLDYNYISKSKVQTSNPSSSPIPLDTPARPVDSAQSCDIKNLGTDGQFWIGMLPLFSMFSMFSIDFGSLIPTIHDSA